MKNLKLIKLNGLILGLGILLSASSFAVANNNGVNPVNTTQNLHGWLTKNVSYPEVAAVNNEQGTVYVSFTISENGLIENVAIAEGATECLNASALEVVSKMPVAELISGSEKYDTTYIVPIKFVIK
ncbi:MAG: energy transducer TonB [Crocinitomicaceae bacterium]|jgi:TonB family protein|nr:energy transducer TonB [Crocinitomicaceae bacterium]